jgi:hypothetical protein
MHKKFLAECQLLINIFMGEDVLRRKVSSQYFSVTLPQGGPVQVA